MSIVEKFYLALVIGAALSFMATLSWCTYGPAKHEPKAEPGVAKGRHAHA